ncbi:MAG: acetylornithine deacetylase [Gammaproteobacteria bacterium]|nr:acetylornithine deacetylase [Gammaproteobacteria bacterium]
MIENCFDEDVLVGWLQQFVRTPSQQTDQQEADPHVLAFIRECAAPLMSELGLDHRFDGRGNLIFEVGPRDTGRSLLFVAYAMTHPASSMQDPFSATLIDTPLGKAVRGRGVAEQKSALAAALAAVAQAARSGDLEGRLIFTLLTAGETGRHDAIESVMAELDGMPVAAIVCIGTGNSIAIGNKGRVDFDITVKGKAAHSSVPWEGVNALSGAWRVLQKLEQFEIQTPPHPNFGPATLTPTAIASWPRATHTIQDTARITCDRRLLPGEDPEQAYDAVARAIELGAPWVLEWRRGPVMFPNEISPDGKLYRRLTAALGSAGLNPTSFHCNFALDSGFFGRNGVESVMFGPGAVDQFHSNEEYVLVADLTAAARVYYELIRSSLSGKISDADAAD